MITAIACVVCFLVIPIAVGKYLNVMTAKHYPPDAVYRITTYREGVVWQRHMLSMVVGDMTAEILSRHAADMVADEPFPFELPVDSYQIERRDGGEWVTTKLRRLVTL